jgi:NADPH:quinone reductase-like Zn-dependent oxidoreductase
MKSLVFERFGDPAEVLQLHDLPLPEPGPGQVRIRMLAVPVNPSDLLVVRGRYGRLPTLPATPGFEGVGVIDAAGPGLLRLLRGLRPGRRVAVLNGAGGNWQEQVVLSARQVVPIADDVPDEQAAMFFVNPATALIMTQRVLRVPAGDWLLQTAAASAVGRMVLRLGKQFGFRTINVVRRTEQADELRRDGAEHVIVSSQESIAERVRQWTGEGARFALDAVGGPTGRDVVEALGAEARMLVYGTLSDEPMPLDSRALMVGQKSITGFWLSEWVKHQGALTMLKLFRQVQRLLRQGVLTSDVGATFKIDNFQQAIAQAQTPGRRGKVLLRFAER